MGSPSRHPQRQSQRRAVLAGVGLFFSLASCGLLFPFAQWHPTTEIDWADVVGEASVALLALVWMTVLNRVRTTTRVFMPLAAGLLGLYIGEFWDVLDEFATVAFGSVIENTGKVAGTALTSMGILRWWMDSSKARRALKASSDHFEQLSIRDPLTKLFNRLHFDERLDQLVPSVGDTTRVSLILMDIDDFKSHNDTYGHAEGDGVIQSIAEVIRASIRDTDVPCRHGGEEFAVLLPAAGLESAARVAERIRAGFEALVHEPRPGETVNKTVSLGVVEASPGEPADELVRRADEALYEAKAAGKNRVVRG